MPVQNTEIGAAMRALFAAGLLTASLTALPGAARADAMMSACKSEIAATCDGVAKGRGRISACLYANANDLSASCKTEVENVVNGATFQRYLPTGEQTLKGSQQEAALRAACTSKADKVCSGVEEGSGRLLACVYARMSTVSNGCEAAAKSILN